MSVEYSARLIGSKAVKRGMVEMVKGGVIMDVANVEQATSAESARSLGGYAAGDRVVFEADGLSRSGVIDDIMPDGSVVWVWPDDAMGRKMLCATDDVSVRHENETHRAIF